MAIPAEYLQLFLADAREQLQRLGLAVVCVEEHPDDRDTVDEIFRIAHSLKASSATLGFSGMAALAHQMEDVFELLRQRTDGLPREAIDALLECLDVLDACVGAIAATGAEDIDPEPLVDRLRGLVRARSAAQKASREVPEARPAPVAAALADGRRVVHLVVRLSADAEMPSVRAFMVLSTLGEHGELLGSVPPLDAVEGFDDHVIEAWLASAERSEAVSGAAAGVADVAEVSAAELEGQRTPARRTTTGSAATRARPRGLATVRVDVERFDRLVDALGELIVHRTEVELLAGAAGMPELERCVAELTRSSEELGQLLAQLRMIPVEAVFLRFPRLVRDLSQTLDKQVELVLVGEDTELDRALVDALGAPLAHLVRNALDHGFETPTAARGGGQAAHRHAADLRPPRRGRGAGRRQRRRARGGPRARRRTGARARPDLRRAVRRVGRRRCDRAAVRARASRRPSRPPRSPAAASAWTRRAPPCASSAASWRFPSVPGEGTTATVRLPLGARPGSVSALAPTGEAVPA